MNYFFIAVTTMTLLMTIMTMTTPNPRTTIMTDSLGDSPEDLSGELASRVDHHNEDTQYLPEVISYITEWNGDRSDDCAHDNSHAGPSDSSEGDYDEVLSEDLTPHGQFMEALESRIQPLLGLLPEAKLGSFWYNFYRC